MTEEVVSGFGIQVKKALEEGYVVVKIDIHEARNTGAFTRWIKPQDAQFIYSTFAEGKTHWYEYYLTRPDSIWVRIRRSNRGNLSTMKLTGKNLKIPKDELDRLIAVLET